MIDDHAVARWGLASAALNVVLLAAAAEKARRMGLRAVGERARLVKPAPNDYAVLGRERFGHLSPGRIGLLGDSQAQNAPLMEMVTDWRQYGIGGATIRDVASWLPSARCDVLVILAGTNDVLADRPVAESVADAAALLDAADRPVVWLSIPPLPARDPEPLNRALRGLCEARGVRWVDVASVIGERWTDDSLHFNRDAYLGLSEVLRQVVAYM